MSKKEDFKMRLEKVGEDRLNVYGSILNLRDSDDLRNGIREILDDKDGISIDILESDTITSSIIGFLLKVCKKEKKDLKLSVKSVHLYDMLKSMELLEVFNVNKI